MATKKGSKITKTTETILRLEVYQPTAERWVILTQADVEEDAAVDWLNMMANNIRAGKNVKFRITKIDTTTRVQVTETIVEGEGKEPTPVAGMT